MATNIPSSPPYSPSGHDGDERFETLVRLRFDADRRTIDAARLGRAMIWFAALWGLVPLIESLVLNNASPLVSAVHLGVVVPWALLVGNRADGRSRRIAPGVAASSVLLTAVSATLIEHRLGGSGDARAFDTMAILPILHLCLWVRPGRTTATVVAGLGLAMIWGAALGWGAGSGMPPPTTIGPLVAASAAVVIALTAGQSAEAEVRRAHLSRLRSDLAAHRLTHRNDELKVLSEVDTLTGLANRRFIDLRLPEIEERSLTGGETVAVMMIDVDHFKSFNDHFGHQQGDRCLEAVARAAGDQIRRKDDLIGRFGGEEFLAVLPGAGLDVAMRVAERIRATIEALGIPQAGGRAGRVVTVSIGCSAGVVTAGRSIEDLLRAADDELYSAKRGGRNRISPPIGDREGGTRAAAGPGEPLLSSAA